jgi:hypothetical protein
MPPKSYYFLSFLASTIIPSSPDFSLQYPLSLKDPHEQSFSHRDRGMVPLMDSEIETNYNKFEIPGNLFRLNYTGIFLVDAADSLVFITIFELSNWLSVS